MPLQQLTSLEFSPLDIDINDDGFPDVHELPQLLRLTQLAALQQLRLLHFDLQYAAAFAPAYGQLPQLCELICSGDGTPLTEQTMATLVAGIAAATSITRLHLYADVTDGDSFEDALEQRADVSTSAAEQRGPPVDVCASLASMTQLEHLELAFSQVPGWNFGTQGLEERASRAGSALVFGNAAALAALTNLTHLHCKEGGAIASVNDEATSALASGLTQLRHLEFDRCDLGGMLCLGAIAQMPHLSVLSLREMDGAGVTQQRLMLLTRLSCLQHFEFEVNAEVTDAVVEVLKEGLVAATCRPWQIRGKQRRPKYRAMVAL
jgi:hypothetical protein